jgi:hypothetical protein
MQGKVEGCSTLDSFKRYARTSHRSRLRVVALASTSARTCS